MFKVVFVISLQSTSRLLKKIFGLQIFRNLTYVYSYKATYRFCSRPEFVCLWKTENVQHIYFKLYF